MSRKAPPVFGGKTERGGGREKSDLFLLLPSSGEGGIGGRGGLATPPRGATAVTVSCSIPDHRQTEKKGGVNLSSRPFLFFPICASGLIQSEIKGQNVAMIEHRYFPPIFWRHHSRHCVGGMNRGKGRNEKAPMNPSFSLSPPSLLYCTLIAKNKPFLLRCVQQTSRRRRNGFPRSSLLYIFLRTKHKVGAFSLEFRLLLWIPNYTKSDK